VPIFLHVGVVHLLVNMVAQLLIGSQIEKEMGMSSSPVKPFRLLLSAAAKRSHTP
jgi:membrane associated rhomboid family serine protease